MVAALLGLLTLLVEHGPESTQEDRFTIDHGHEIPIDVLVSNTIIEIDEPRPRHLELDHVVAPLAHLRAQFRSEALIQTTADVTVAAVRPLHRLRPEHLLARDDVIRIDAVALQIRDERI